MTLEHLGTLDELKSAIAILNLSGEWNESDGSGPHQFRVQRGPVVNWWPSTGTISVQGKANAKAELENQLEGVLLQSLGSGPAATEASATTGRRIFVVHGHDTDARDQLELILRRLGLEPYILMNMSGGGQTIIEALEGHIGGDHSADFGIVLFTPDDKGFSNQAGPDNAEPRARQNVVLEAGMLLSSLTRKRMALLVKGHVELPSDLQGVIQLRFNQHVREIVPKLCGRLRESGIECSPEKIEAASA